MRVSIFIGGTMAAYCRQCAWNRPSNSGVIGRHMDASYGEIDHGHGFAHPLRAYEEYHFVKRGPGTLKGLTSLGGHGDRRGGYSHAFHYEKFTSSSCVRPEESSLKQELLCSVNFLRVSGVIARMRATQKEVWDRAPTMIASVASGRPILLQPQDLVITGDIQGPTVSQS